MFKSGHVSIWLSRKIEKEILSECKLHADAVVATVAEMRKAVHSFCEETWRIQREILNWSSIKNAVLTT